MKFTQTIPTILRADVGSTAPMLRARRVIPITGLGGIIYGTVMGSFGGCRAEQILFSALKVPLLLGVSFALTVPCFFLLNTLAGVRDDFQSAFRAVCAAQAGLAISLSSLSPFVALWYVSCADYPWAILFNGVMFAAATFTGQVLLRRYYRRLIDRNPRHRILMRLWTTVYGFTAIQMAWVLRPFVGGPLEPTSFFRAGAWGNAYVVVGNLVVHSLRR